MSKQFQGRSRVWLTTGLLLLGIMIATAATLRQTNLVGASPASSATLSNDECMACHGESGMTLTLESEEILWLSIDANKFTNSVHNLEEVACVDCHTDITAFPHPERSAHSLRELSLELYTSCKECHSEQYDKTLDSMHERTLAGGDTNAAICTDCHNPHTQARMTHPVTGEILLLEKVKIPQTCARCHSTIYETYKQSVHGYALTSKYNQDVPTCIDCHGVHNIGDPRTASYRLESPQICASCHTDSDMMDKYGVSTDVVDTYVADFHGATIELFEKRSPDHDSNKPVCYDCHGIHDIKSPDDPDHGIALKENLLITCQRCHPEADANFPDSWMSHYVPDAEHYPIVFYVDWFYKILIPVVIGGMLLFVISDIVRRIIDKRKGASHS
ncbi:MAG: ammonia-forming cytochrome c nitrite reductase subunit c552 [Anaerolineae bacterium]|jgi:nitrate/TMAO reductase-like tetraheme cytochrome c subunit|nr:ammonia-forming cytochrome c nitrite reductase subunit c552 [Anaerolineae bacterium]MBT7071044.1 ammonia-forming cytochrome c nitrite reductase subunit c552 [Anaerolineae bacterium]